MMKLFAWVWLMLFCAVAQAEVYAVVTVPSNVDTCKYVNHTRGESFDISVEVDTKRGEASYGYRVCKADMMPWTTAPHDVEFWSKIAATGQVSEQSIRGWLTKPAVEEYALAWQEDVPPPPVEIDFTMARSAIANSDPATATLSASPTPGSLLVVVAMERSGTTSANHTITGSGWTKRVARNVLLTDSTYRRSLTIWTKVAGQNEPASITVDDGTANAKRVIFAEFKTNIPATWKYETSAANDNGAVSSARTLFTGSTPSVAAGKLLVLGALAIKPANAYDHAVTWTNGLTTVVEADASIMYDRALFLAMGTQTAGGTKSSTATLTPTNSNNTGLISALLVFSAVAN